VEVKILTVQVAGHPLAPIRLTNAAAQLPYGSGETKGVQVTGHPQGVPLHFREEPGTGQMCYTLSGQRHTFPS